MEWISVSKSLPALHGEADADGNKYFISVDVLAFCTDDYGMKREVVAYFEQDDTGYFYTGWAEAMEGTQLKEVTHWMPLPEPPHE